MTAIGSTNHAFFFDGVSDSILIPEGAFRAVGKKNAEGGSDVSQMLSNRNSDTSVSVMGANYPFLTIEAWVMPDCGGTIIEKEGQYKLSLGHVDTPGPATFKVTLLDNGHRQTHEISSALAVSAGNRYDGTVFPRPTFGGIHDSYNRFDTTNYGLATDLNRNHRELLHVVAAVRPKSIELYINAELVAKKKLKSTLGLVQSNSNTYVGGKGGQFRGVMEAVHIAADFKNTLTNNNCPLAGDDTILLYRFEEPILPVEKEYTFTTLTGGYDTDTLSTMTITTEDAKELAKTLTGNTVTTGTIDLTASPYSSGSYEIYDASTGTNVNRTVAHVPYNLLINPGSINRKTKKPNGTPPERVRLHSINVDTGVLTISSIHLDHNVDTNSGLVGVINKTRTTDIDDYFVVIGADLLIDNKSGKVYQPPHYNTQIIDRTGQMVIDESGYDHHGFVFSSRMATTDTDTNNPYAVAWPLTNNDGWKIGHSGRHARNHVDGHSFLTILPKASDEIVHQRGNGRAELIDLVYDEMQDGVDQQIAVNSKIDVYRDLEQLEVANVVNTSLATSAINSYQNTNNPPAGKRELIAIGGDSFDYTPFLLKGPTPSLGGKYEADIRKHHLRPSSKSRVALLHVPQLKSTNVKFAPYVEIHYNAIDLTGESMHKPIAPNSIEAGKQYIIVSNVNAPFTNIGAADNNVGTIFTATASGSGIGTVRRYQPLLMVEKTVPAGNIPTGGGSYVYDAIASSLASGKKLYSAGGVIECMVTGDKVLATPHAMIGDNSEGYEADFALDESLVPANYTPRAISTSGNNTPTIIKESSSTTGTHESVFNKLTIDKILDGGNLTVKGGYERLEPEIVPSSPSAGEFDIGLPSVSSHIHEVFDIIDNVETASAISNMKIIVQPSDRRRTNQLSSLKSLLRDTDQVNVMTPMYLLSRARVRAIKESEGENASLTTIQCVGLAESAVTRSVSLTGSGSPDSHIVKEIEPNAPVVTVTLGGPGQGAMDTAPVNQRSVLAHESYSTRRAYAVTATRLDIDFTGGDGILHIEPLNNKSTSLSSWGTYGFPKVGRIYLPDGTSAKYSSKTGTTFTFLSASIGSGDFVSSRGREFDTIHGLLNAAGYMKGNVSGTTATVYGNFTIFNEPDFGENSNLENGTTINDRMHQSLNDVSHDYQLGTQFASTRALAEIPVFSKQFFHNNVGPDNAFKIHIDATHTAHTYNPSPVGRRVKGVEPSDREAQSAYAYAISQNKHVKSATVTFWNPTMLRIFVDDSSIFPSATNHTSSSPTAGVFQHKYRKVFTAEGEWGWYENNPSDDAVSYIQIVNLPHSMSENFASSLEVGSSVFVGGPVVENATPMASDDLTPSSDFESRGEFYYDAASVKTQGGNVDYGLRQYVSAVEFKAGPESNPHAARVETGRARGTVQAQTEESIGIDVNEKVLVVTLNEEDFKKFPDLDYDTLAAAPTEQGQLLYVVEHEDNGTIYKYHYHGHLKNIRTDVDIPKTSIVLGFYEYSVTYPNSLEGKEIYLARKSRKAIQDLNVGTTANPIYNQGNTAQYSSALYDEVLGSTYKVGTTTTVSGSTITVTTAAGKSLNDLHGGNLKKGDYIYFYTTGGAYGGTFFPIGTVSDIATVNTIGEQVVTVTGRSNLTPGAGTYDVRVSMGDYIDRDAVLNATWLNPYAPGGLRNGDTIWANMSYNNPHAVEGLFAKSRGVYDESQVWQEFNGGLAQVDDNPRDSVPIENFLIGNTCLETARNYVQHVNRTIEENYAALGIATSKAPTVAYIDPYLSAEDHARVLLYDVRNDREFAAFQDLHMQVQSSPQTTQLGWPKEVVEESGTTSSPLYSINAKYNGAGPSPWTTQIDVANGFPSQNPYIRSTQQSKFIEGAYAHDLANRHTSDLIDSTTTANLSVALPTDGRVIAGSRLYGKAHGHHVHTGYSYGGLLDGYKIGNSTTLRTNDSTALYKKAEKLHYLSRIENTEAKFFIGKLIDWRSKAGATTHTMRDPSTFFDTPDGTRVIPAFLCLRGIRSETLDLSSHELTYLDKRPQWTNMDFVRRLTLDMGEIALRDGVTNVQNAAEEVVRLINQHAALNARTGGGSAHDPHPFWDYKVGKNDKGTHMGYIRAHIGREVEDLNGDRGFTIVIHSTVPGASGRNFCAWLDNSKGQTAYQPQFLIGHGGRWRNFWALPEESEGENMHPAPMPLNKHGRPFAPVTTLQQYISTQNTGEDVTSVADFEDSNLLRAVSESLSGSSNNTASFESLDVKGSTSSLVKGLRTGTRAMSRINFGGLVAAGIPGWSPIAGTYGMGKKNDTLQSNRYGTILSNQTYSSHIPTSQITSDSIGSEPIYGFRLKNNIGIESGVRLIYRKMGDSIANENTILPNTIEDEVCIFFDDRSVSDGGFTIGAHMHGSGESTGRSAIVGNGTVHSWFGNEWRGVPSPSVATVMNASYNSSNSALTITYVDGYDSKTDKGLSYLGFPKENGVFQASVNAGDVGKVYSYSKRVDNVFYGVTPAISSGDDYLISPSINWTCILTDEVIAAAVAAAINAGDEINSDEGLTFNCTDMYATDGRTFAEWGIKPESIKIRAFSTNSNVRPLSRDYSATLQRDLGIQASHLEFGELERAYEPTGTEDWDFGLDASGHYHAVSDEDIDAGQSIDCGYIPYNLLEITTKGRGPHANTATPVLVDSQNTPVDTRTWMENLKGMRFTRSYGDHILPKIDNPMGKYIVFPSVDAGSFIVGRQYQIISVKSYAVPQGTPDTDFTAIGASNNDTGTIFTATGVGSGPGTAREYQWDSRRFLTSTLSKDGVFIPPQNATANVGGAHISVGEKKKIFFRDGISATVSRYVTSTISPTASLLIWDDKSQSDNWPEAPFTQSVIFSLFADPKRSREFAGLRSVGSVMSEPIVYFRGGKSGDDHSVPLFFGGGFSGVVMDVNDGTQNDYSSFYTHPYANGPMGVAGLQNANEISTSHAILDANAMFAFFPGAALCNQHRGSITPPAFNKDNVLSPDLDKGATKYSNPAGNNDLTHDLIKAKAVPLVLRFAHQTARYEDHVDGVDIDSKTTYLIFGPGQAFPFMKETTTAGLINYSHGDTGNGSNTIEPYPGRVVTVGNHWASPPPPMDTALYFTPPSQPNYNTRAGFHWRAMVNWESPAGYANKSKLAQRPAHGRHYGQQFNDDTPTSASDLSLMFPRSHTPTIGFGIAMAADTVFHMDGGFHPGGHWMDNQITFNPPHPNKATRIKGAVNAGGSNQGVQPHWEAANQVHPTAFRASGVMIGRVVDYLAGIDLGGQGGNQADAVSVTDAKMEYIVVDGTRCQNGEELATVVGAAINAFPGAGALKAMGGTHMPSMGNAMRQDRYAWVDIGAVATYDVSSTAGYNILSGTADGNGTTFTQAYLEQIPASGWLRLYKDDGGSEDYAWTPYHSREVLKDSSNWKVKFYMSPNRLKGVSKAENSSTFTANSFPTIDSSYDIYVWTKAGTMRFNNENATSRDHMCQVHFSGIADAIDRTRPIGSVGWHGERYSYLNSLKITTSVTKNSVTTNSTGYAAGLGAYHPMLAFSPYGTAGTVVGLHSHVPVVTSMFGSPESTPSIDGIGNNLGTHMKKTDFYSQYNHISSSGGGWNSYTYNFNDTDETGNANQWADPSNYAGTLPEELTRPQGLYSHAFVVVSYNAESTLICKRDNDGIEGTGDWLHVHGQSSNPIEHAGTTRWDERIHGEDRFIAPANAGPNVEALILDNTTLPNGTLSNTDWADTTFTHATGTGSYFHTAVTGNSGSEKDRKLKNAVPGLNKIGDLLFDLDHSVGSALLESGDAERNTAAHKYSTAHSASYPTPYWLGDVNGFQMYEDSAVHNFSVENIVWKRMDGGNLSLPASNARGLGAVPWTTRISSNIAYTTGEKLLGNVRFTFETTNGAMLPVLQAQELSHPELMKKNPYTVNNVLMIPNEEVQFRSIKVIDDTGETHNIEGGSPLGTVIRGFRSTTNRNIGGRAPALANSGNAPNLKVMLPNPDSIPGNIVVRSGFDPLQAYQNETIGSGGMHHPDLGSSDTGHLFNNTVAGPRMSPTYEDHNWERIDPVTFNSQVGAWNNNAPLDTSYELHDRTLFFHVTKMGHSHTHRYPTVYTHALGVRNYSGNVSSWDATNGNLKMNSSVNNNPVFDNSITVSAGDDILNYSGFGTKEVSDNRRFIRMYDTITEEGVVMSYTSTGTNGAEQNWFKGVTGDTELADFLSKYFTLNDTSGEYEPNATVKVVPSYYVPAGSTRFFAARRMRDHAEVSGNSPDMAETLYFNGDSVAYNAYSRPKLTPMPFPRMGHHFVTPTMPMLPGHWAHPAYQSLYKRHLLDYGIRTGFKDTALFDNLKTQTNKKSDAVFNNLADNINPLEPEINFSAINAAPSGPSDIHGGAFSLMFETGIRYDGYGVLASSGTNAGDINKLGGHSVVLEAAGNYTLGRHFPDPVEVGAYQIVIQPNVFDNQLVGYHNHGKLTSQQINTVIAIKEDATKGGLTLVLAKEVGADVRGCEIFVNEVMLDINPDPGSQFTNIPTLMSYNPLGVQLTESPSFTRRGFPYSVMFSPATPGYTLNIPWWSILHKEDPSGTLGLFLKMSQYTPHDYYHICRNTFGSIGKQLTINGYTSAYIDIYSGNMQSTSIIPKGTVISFDSNSGRIQIDNSNLFPLKNYYSEVVEYTAKNGNKYSKPLVNRSGSNFDINKANYIQVAGGSDAFWTNLFDGAVLRMSSAFNNIPTGTIITDKRRSIFANILDDVISGNSDTNSGYVPDAFLCMWHHNLGRPNTYFLDSRTAFGGNAVDKKPYNSLPEHFETIHYHDFSYAISNGPFDFLIKTPSVLLKDGTAVVGSALSQQDAGGTNVMLAGYWPCGSRGGAQASDLGYYSMVGAAWNAHDTSKRANFSSATQYKFVDSDDDGSYAISAGITTTTAGATERRAYGHRFGVLQATNRPRYGLSPARMVYENTANIEGKNTTDADSGPLVQMESTDWEWGGNGTSSSTFPTTYVGVMERQTNFAGMLGHDKQEMQVRYSDGRRMTRPFGAPVRTIRNPSAVRRDWWGDVNGLGITSLSVASQHYLVDWWGNERGEDVRRAPVRGFGIRPAWDAGDAYEYDRRNNRSPYRRVWNDAKPIFNLKGLVNFSNGNVSVTAGYTIPRFGGTDNDENLSGDDNDLVDVFAPTHALRVGDMGNGRGIRYPTMMNEDVLTALSEPIHKTGIVLSHNTAEPLFGDGLLRPRDDLLQNDEVKRGISARLGIDDKGLIKLDAVVSDRVEKIVGDTPHKSAISRSSPRIGLDAEVSEDIEQSHVVINTEAHSLHTDRNVGQRVTLLGASNLLSGASSLGDAEYTTASFARQAGGSPINSVQKYSHTNIFRPYGGSYMLESFNYGGLFDDTGWGLANLTGSANTSNPYQDSTFSSNTARNNESDSIVRFLLRPIRLLDNKHVEVFRPHDSLHSTSPQYAQNYLRATAGGKYGMFTYETPGGRVGIDNIPTGRSMPDANGPYIPIFAKWDSALQIPDSKGPKIPGTEASGYDSTSLLSTITTATITDNTLQHHRSDAPRRRQVIDTDTSSMRMDYRVKPRFSQALHGKGHKGDINFNTSDHSGDGA